MTPTPAPDIDPRRSQGPVLATWRPICLHATWWAVPTELSREVVSASHLSAVPFAQGPIKGCVWVRGQAVAAIQWGALVGVASTLGLPEPQRALVVTGSGMQVALLCHEVGDVEQGLWTPSPPMGCVMGQAHSSHGTLGALDVVAIIQAAKPRSGNTT